MESRDRGDRSGWIPRLALLSIWLGLPAAAGASAVQGTVRGQDGELVTQFQVLVAKVTDGPPTVFQPRPRQPISEVGPRGPGRFLLEEVGTDLQAIWIIAAGYEPEVIPIWLDAADMIEMEIRLRAQGAQGTPGAKGAREASESQGAQATQGVRKTQGGPTPSAHLFSDATHQRISDLTQAFRQWNRRRFDCFRAGASTPARSCNEGDEARDLQRRLLAACGAGDDQEKEAPKVRAVAAVLLVNAMIQPDKETAAKIREAAPASSQVWGMAPAWSGLGGQLGAREESETFLEEVARTNVDRTVRGHGLLHLALLAESRGDEKRAKKFVNDLLEGYSDLPLVQSWLEDQRRSSRWQVGDRLPDFQLTSGEGGVSCAATIGQKWTVLEVWIPSCLACLGPLRDLREIHALLEEKGVQVLSLVLGATPDSVKEVGLFDVPWKQFILVDAVSKDVETSLDIRAYPTMFLLDETGRIVFHGPPPQPGELLEKIDLAFALRRGGPEDPSQPTPP